MFLCKTNIFMYIFRVVKFIMRERIFYNNIILLYCSVIASYNNISAHVAPQRGHVERISARPRRPSSPLQSSASRAVSHNIISISLLITSKEFKKKKRVQVPNYTHDNIVCVIILLYYYVFFFKDMGAYSYPYIWFSYPWK